MNKTFISILALVSLLGLAPAQALEFRAPFTPSLLNSLLAGIQDYQIGSEWGKKPVTSSILETESVEFVRAAMATAAYGGATAFYLGKINGKHLMGTNHHVQDSNNCGGSARFQVIGKAFACGQVFGHWSDIDFALFEITVPVADEQVLSGLGRGFAFDRPLMPGQQLLTIGHGIAGNPGRKLVANQDSDCKVFSGEGESRFMADPDEFNPADYKAWSFSNGCDVSHGDSGSAMVDRLTGDPVGIIWTGRIPKAAETQSSATLDAWLQGKNPKIWTELSYAVPASKIQEHLLNYLKQNPDLARETSETISAFLR